MTLLSAWLAETQTSVPDLATRLDVAPSTVYRWRDGVKVPRPEQVAALERLTKGSVTANDHQAAFTARNRSLMGKPRASRKCVSSPAREVTP